ncbi:MAG TPA: DJ-1/PfpI family protein [Candidatus Altiarchaeales archaeon]|nr:DJ-1/PfpI family protein [Candidatus Altiarchaeales archaeon]
MIDRNIFAILIISSIFLSCCVTQEDKKNEKIYNLEVKNLKILIILMPENFRDEEFKIPKEKLERSGVSVIVAGLQTGEARGMLGMTATPDTTIDNISIDEYDAIIVPGGSGSPKYLWDNEKVHQILREGNEKGKIIAGICLSGAVLAKAGVLEGKNATVFATPESLKALEEGGALYKKEPVVVDGNIVTADGPSSAGRFADEILKLLASK